MTSYTGSHADSSQTVPSYGPTRAFLSRLRLLSRKFICYVGQSCMHLRGRPIRRIAFCFTIEYTCTDSGTVEFHPACSETFPTLGVENGVREQPSLTKGTAWRFPGREQKEPLKAAFENRLLPFHATEAIETSRAIWKSERKDEKKMVIIIGLAAVSQQVVQGDVTNTVNNIFYRGRNGHLWTIGNQSNWAPTDLGGVQLSSAPAAVSRDLHRMDVFYIGPNGHLWTSWWDGRQSQWWSAATDLGGVQLSSAPAAVSRNSNRMDVFYVGPNGHLWTSWWDSTQSQWWSAATDLGNAWPTSAPAAVSINPNRIDVYYAGPNGHLWTSWWDGRQSQWWSAATDLGGVQLSSAPAAAFKFGELDVYYCGPDGDLWVSRWDPRPTIGGWSPPSGLKTGLQLTTSPAVALFVDSVPPGTIGGTDGIAIYYGGPNGHLWRQALENQINSIFLTPPKDLGEVDFT